MVSSDSTLPPPSSDEQYPDGCKWEVNNVHSRAFTSAETGPTRFRRLILESVPDSTRQPSENSLALRRCVFDAGAMTRRMEDHIRRLCEELLAASDDRVQIQKVGELRLELQLHVQRLRARLSKYPIAEERRVAS